MNTDRIEWEKFEELMDEVVEGAVEDVENGAPWRIAAENAKDNLRQWVEELVSAFQDEISRIQGHK